MGRPRRFRVRHPETLRLRWWRDECVLFESRSGDTHLLARPVAHLVERLAQTPASVSELQEHLAARAGQATPREEVDGWLRQLQTLGLVERETASDLE